MYGKKFKINDQVIILYDDKEFVIPEELKFEDLGECSPVVDATIPAFRYNDFLTSLFTGKSTQDKVLDSEGINSFQDLQYAYNLVRNKALNKPKRVRDYVVEKYTKLLEFYD